MPTIGNLVVAITAQTGKFEAGLRKTSRLLSQFKGTILNIGGIAGLGSLVHWFDESAGTLFNLSQSTHIAVEQLDFLRYAAEQTSTPFEALTKATRNLFQRGIDPNRFVEIANRISAITDPIRRAQAAMYYFGRRSGTALIPLANQVGDLSKRFKQLGGGITARLAEQANNLGDRFLDVRLAVRNTAFALADALALRSFKRAI